MNTPNQTTVSITNEYGTYTTSIDKTAVRLETLIEEVIIPALLAVGYSDEAINKHIPGAQL